MLWICTCVAVLKKEDDLRSERISSLVQSRLVTTLVDVVMCIRQFEHMHFKRTRQTSRDHTGWTFIE